MSTDVELQIEAPEMNGCDDYEVVMRVGDAEVVQKQSPSCPD